MAFDETQVLAKESEEALLYRDMQADLVQQIMRRLAAVKTAGRRRKEETMQLRPEALDGHLAKGLAPLYVITSDEHLLALEAADKIRSKARAQGIPSATCSRSSAASSGASCWPPTRRCRCSATRS
jgi:hypothetical protein